MQDSGMTTTLCFLLLAILGFIFYTFPYVDYTAPYRVNLDELMRLVLSPPSGPQDVLSSSTYCLF